MSKYPTAAGMDPEDAGRALMGRTVKKSNLHSRQNSTEDVPRDEDLISIAEKFAQDTISGLIRDFEGYGTTSEIGIFDDPVVGFQRAGGERVGDKRKSKNVPQKTNLGGKLKD